MLNSRLIEKVRLTSDVIATICSAYPDSVCLKKVVSAEPVLIRGKTFSDIEISGSRFKDALTFIDCRFKGQVSLRQVKAGGQVSFINCEFSSDLKLFGLEINGPLSFIDTRLNGRVVINGSSTPKLDIQSLSAKSLLIKAEEVPSNITAMALKNLSVSGATRIDNVNSINELDITTSGLGALQLRHLGLITGATLSINESRIDEVLIDNLSLPEAKVRFESTLGENIMIRQCDMAKATVSFNQVLLNGMLAIKHCTYETSEIDLSSLTSPNLDLDDDLVNFVTARQTVSSAIYMPSLTSDKRIQVLKLLKDKFAQEHRYDLEDAVFYILKNVEATRLIQQASWWRKPLLGLGYALNRTILGWGVRLRNPVISALAAVGACAIVYYIVLGLHSAQNSVDYLGQKLTGLAAASTYSVLAFFGQHADAKASGSVPIGLALGEFTLGITMTTIIVGILIRKLVR